MINSQFVTGILKTTVSLLLMGGIWLWPLTMVAKTVPTPKYTVQHLEEVVARNWAEWPWGVGGQAADLAEDSEVDSVYELTNHSSLDWEIQTRSQDWLHLNRGDGSKDLVRTAIVRF